jgi:hypothetical protein
MADPAIEEESNIVEDNKTANAIASMLWCWKYINREVVTSGPLDTITPDSVAIERGDFTKVPVGSFLKPGGPTISTTLVTYRHLAYDSNYDHDIERENPRFLALHPLPVPNGYASIEATYDAIDATAKSFQKSADLTRQLIANGIHDDGGRDIVVIGLKKSTAIVTTDSPILMFEDRDVFYLASKPPQYYLRFGALLRYIKEELLPKINTNKPSHYDNPSIFDIDYGQYVNFMYSLPNQISLDPKVCIVKNLKFQKIPSTVQVFTNLEPFLVEDFNPSTALKNQAYTMNIYLNFEFILESLNSNVDERGDISVYNFLKVVCDGLNKSLGGINNLEPTINEENNTLTITETTPIPGRIKSGSYFLQLYGYKGIQSTFVRKVDLKTAITPEYATMITVGATAGGYVKGTEATAFSRWNKGLTDRFQEKYLPGNENSLPNGGLDEAVTNYTTEMLSKVSLCYGFTGNLYGAPPELGGLSEDAIATNLSVGTEYYKYLVASNKNQQGGTVGFIPFKISFTMDGISGIKIYNVLHVDTRFLPKAYGDNVDLIVTGVTHKLSDNDWQTDIEATVMPKTSNLASIVIDPSVIAEQIKQTPPIQPPVSGSGGIVGVVTNLFTDPAPQINPRHIGANAVTETTNPVASNYVNTRKIKNFRSYTTYADFKKFVIDTGNVSEIGTSDGVYFANPGGLASISQLKNKFYLHPTAATQFKNWMNEVKGMGLKVMVTSAARIGSNTGAGPHGWGMAIDFNQFYQTVGGSTDPDTNERGRIASNLYQKVASIGTKYGWYNPWRLSDGTGQDEMWHFEYWGNY